MEDDFGAAEELADGELWLPSDFFSMDDSSSSNTKPSYMNNFSNFNIMDNNHPQNSTIFKYPQYIERVQPATRVGSPGFSSECIRGFCSCGTRSGSVGYQPVYRYQRQNPIETFMGERAWALQTEQRTRFALNRVLPRMGLGVSGGTGVFLPRISNSTPSTGINYKHRHDMFNRKNIQQLPPRMMLLNQRQEECHGYVTGDQMQLLNARRTY